MNKISIAILLILAYNTACVDRVIPEKLGILTSLPRTLLSGAMTGDSTMSKKIPLTQGKVAIVDDEDYKRLSKYKWYADKIGNTYYAVRNIGKRLKQRRIWMHREILHTPKGMETDHQSRNGLDNRKTNLRIATHSQNMQNQRFRTGCSSKYRGVGWWKRDKKWYARIKHNYKSLHLGYFVDEIEAAKAYDKKAKELFGEFALTNFN